MTRFLAVLLTCLAFLAPAARAAEEAFFPLGLWYEGGVGDARDNVLPADPAAAAKVYDDNFADIAAHGINLIVVPNSPPAHHQIVLDAAQKHGLKVILELGLDGGPFGHMIRGQRAMDRAAVRKELQTVLAPIKDHPALLRVQLLDEPPADAFERYGTIADAVRRFSPKTEPFCCLTGISDGGAFLKASGSDVVAFDMYPVGAGAKEGDAAPLNAFAQYAGRFADWAQAAHARSWAVVQCHAITGALRFPTPAELRCMTYASLATGNKGVFWFLYQTEAFGPKATMDGLVDRQFKPRPLWDEVAKLTARLKPLVPVLQRLTPDRKTKIGCPETARAYALRDGDGGLYVFAVNFDALRPQTITLAAPADRSTAVVRVPGGEDCAAKRGAEGALVWEAKLDAGEGMLFRVK
jgi:hypothetical protein